MKEKHTAWKGLLKTIFATTFSIVLTFGTAALIDRHKQAKRETTDRSHAHVRPRQFPKSGKAMRLHYPRVC